MDDPLYSTPVSTDLVISSTSLGIVNNDFEIDSASLVASVVANPSHGSLISFNSNGTFTYRPTTGYSGPDSFTYKVSNGSLDSNIATVSLQVGQVFGPRTNLNEIPLSSVNLTSRQICSPSVLLWASNLHTTAIRSRVQLLSLRNQLALGRECTIEHRSGTFGGVTGSNVTYSTSGLSAGAPLRFALQVD